MAVQVAVYEHPWRQGGGALWVLLCGAYVAIFGVYWLGNLAHLVMDMRSLIEARACCSAPQCLLHCRHLWTCR